MNILKVVQNINYSGFEKRNSRLRSVQLNRSIHTNFGRKFSANFDTENEIGQMVSKFPTNLVQPKNSDRLLHCSRRIDGN